MGKIPRNQGKDWTRQEVKALRRLAKEKAPTRVIGPEAGTNSGFNSQQGSARRNFPEADEPIALQSTQVTYGALIDGPRAQAREAFRPEAT
jgi:hypothetical protein